MHARGVDHYIRAGRHRHLLMLSCGIAQVENDVVLGPFWDDRNLEDISNDVCRVQPDGYVQEERDEVSRKIRW